MDENLTPRVRYWLSEAKYDCYFVVGPEDGPTERIGAIKVLLMGDSEPFRAMLQDSVLAEEGDIRVKDVEPETFKNFLMCVYGASTIVIASLNFEESAKLLYVIEKYLVNTVKTELTKHMEDIFSLSDIYVALSHEICFEETSLKDKIIYFITYNFDSITKDDKFLALNYIAIRFIVQIIFIPVEEIEVWNALLRWAKHKTGSTDGKILRRNIFPLLKYIRFLTMDYNDFDKNVVSSGILLEEEVSDICKAFLSGNPCTIKYLCKSRRNRYNVQRVCKQIVSKFVSNPKYAIIQLTVSSVSSFVSGCYTSSNTYYWCEYLFYIEVSKISVDENDQLAVFLGCEGKKSNWSCNVDLDVSLINQLGKPDVLMFYKSTRTFSESGDKIWGWESFYSWNDLLNESKGFVRDDSLILVAKIQLKN